MTPEFTRGQIHPIDCVKEGFAAIKDAYWMLFAISLVGGLIAGVSMYVLVGPMVCGIMICYLKKLDGGPVVFDDLWLGFKYFGRSLLVTILFVVPLVVYILGIFLTMYLPLIMQAMSGGRVDDNTLLRTMFIGFGVDFVIAIVMVSIHSMLIFAFPLIVDRGLNSVDAIKLSARAALKNMGGVAGLIGVNFAIAVAGELMCGVGLYLAIPILTVTNVVAYRKVFPTASRPSLDPPSPTAYPEIA